ncbi:MAG: o-succinylbenzoate--CoA ligase [Melioribacteraceae bacterium]|nr:o-succinylbenzoate--CoA ligase [Melioribacteraceae bacterium]
MNQNSNWLLKQTELNGDACAVKINQKQITYSELKHLIHERTKELASSINNEDIVGILAEHSIQFIIDLFALWNYGAAVLPINPNLKESEIQDQINFIGCKTLSKKEIDTTTEFEYKNYSSDSIALIMFTSGSTGKPKAVVHTFESLYSSAESIDKLLQFKQNEKWLASLPFYRIGGFQIILRAILSGGTICIPTEVSSEEISNSISLYQPDYISVVNPILEKLTATNKEELQNSKAVFAGGGPVESNLIKKGIENGISIYKVYGSTETGSMVSILHPKEAAEKFESAGKPLPGVKIKIDDDQICVSASSLFKEYYKNKEQTTDKLFNNWYYTGDEGYIDKDGFLFVTNRKDNFIISGGEKVDPKEIEKALTSFDKIEKAIVFSVPDKKWGEKICAAVVSKTNLDLDEIHKSLKQILPSYKIPKMIKQIESIPFDEMGKANLTELQNLFD